MSGKPHLRIVRGNPSDEELAALVAVVTTMGSGAEPEPEPPRSAWSERRARVREPLPHGHGAWRASGFPR